MLGSGSGRNSYSHTGIQGPRITELLFKFLERHFVQDQGLALGKYEVPQALNSSNSSRALLLLPLGSAAPAFSKPPPWLLDDDPPSIFLSSPSSDYDPVILFLYIC